MNRVQIIGRLGNDPVISRSARGPVANFSVATNEQWTDAMGAVKEHTEWHQVVCYDRNAEIAGEYLVKGDEVFVEGRQRTSHYTDKEGRPQKGIQLRAERFRMFARSQNHSDVIRELEVIQHTVRSIAAGEDVATLDQVVDMIGLSRWKLLGEPEGV